MKISTDSERDLRLKQFEVDIEFALQEKVIREVTDEHRRATVQSSLYSRPIKIHWPSLEYEHMLDPKDIESLKQEVKRDFGVYYRRIMVVVTIKDELLYFNFLYMTAE